MKKLKKISCLALAVLLLAALFMGCGGQGEKSSAATEAPATQAPKPTEAPAETAAPTEAPAEYPFELSYIPVTEETTVTLWCSFNPQALTVVESLADTSCFKEMEEITGVTIDATSIAGNVARDAFNILINSGDYPDIIGNLSTLYKGLDAAVDDGIAIDLMPYLEEYSPNFWHLINEKSALKKHLTTDEGRIVRYTSFSMDGALAQLGNVIRQDWLDELGLEVPATYDQLHDVLTAFKTEKNVTAGLWLNYMGLGCNNALTNGYDVAGWYDVMQGYAPFNVIDGQVQFCWTTQGMKDYLTMMHQWYEEGLVWKDFVSDTPTNNVSNSNGMEQVLNDNMGVFCAEIGHITSIPAQTDSSMVLTGLADVSKTAGETLHNFPISIGVGQASWSISTDCDESKYPIIMNWIDYLFTPDGSDLASWGVDGEASTTNPDGTKQFTDLILHNPDGLSMMVVLSLYTMQAANPYLLQLDRDKAVYNEAQLAAADAWVSNQDGAHAFPDSAALNADESGEYSTIWADLGTYASESIPKFVIGDLSLDSDWDAFVGQLDELGAARLAELKQAAYERYLAK